MGGFTSFYKRQIFKRNAPLDADLNTFTSFVKKSDKEHSGNTLKNYESKRNVDDLGAFTTFVKRNALDELGSFSNFYKRANEVSDYAIKFQ